MADREHNSGRGHEGRDINVAKVALIGVLLLGLIAIVGHFVPWFVFDFMAAQTEGEGPPPSPLLSADQTPPPPRLQVQAPVDLAKLRSAEADRLNTYAWTDRANGVVRIPIGRAMQLLAGKGIGSPQQDRSPGDAPAQAGATANPAKLSGSVPGRK